jgi:hypothetical protein
MQIHMPKTNAHGGYTTRTQKLLWLGVATANWYAAPEARRLHYLR